MAGLFSANLGFFSTSADGNINDSVFDQNLAPLDEHIGVKKGVKALIWGRKLQKKKKSGVVGGAFVFFFFRYSFTGRI